MWNEKTIVVVYFVWNLKGSKALTHLIRHVFSPKSSSVISLKSKDGSFLFVRFKESHETMDWTVYLSFFSNPHLSMMLPIIGPKRIVFLRWWIILLSMRTKKSIKELILERKVWTAFLLRLDFIQRSSIWYRMFDWVLLCPRVAILISFFKGKR